MKIACFVLLLLALATRQCLAFDSEFGRLAVEDNLDLEEYVYRRVGSMR